MSKQIITIGVVVGTVVALAVVFGILQPVLWKPIFGETPPSQVTDLSLMLTLFLALLTIGIAVFGVGAWRLLREEMKAEMEAAVLRSDRRVTRALASLLANVGYTRYIDYEVTQYPNQLDEAIRFMEEAWGDYGRFLEDSDAESELLICQIKNNRGLFLAIRERSSDASIARECSDYLEGRLGDYGGQVAESWIDTIATIQRMFPKP